MKINFLKSLVLRTRTRSGLALLASLISIWFALTPGAAQSKNQKRITGLHIGEASEGSRVTVVSDSALSDYEAFRRGDRFYVRIPLADFNAGKPGFRGDGFEDVQVQKVGDSVVVSFKLQPGATARVDQRSNRLDVIFSAPNRIARSNRTNAGSNRGTYVPTDGIVRANNWQTPQHRERDAGPMPPGSPGRPQASRERVVTGRVSDFQTPHRQSALPNPRENSGRRTTSRPADNIAASKSGASSSINRSDPTATISKPGSSGSTKAGSSPTASKNEPSPNATPSTYPPLATGTAAAPVPSQPAVKSPGLTGSQNGKSWSDTAFQWVKANRQATLLGALLLLCMLVLLAALLFRRRKNGVKAKRAGSTLAQPKQSFDPAPNSPNTGAPVNPPASSTTPRDFVKENTTPPSLSELSPLAVPVASAKAPRTSGIQENVERGKPVPEQAVARSASVAAPSNHAWVPGSPSTGSSKDEDQEREVFEL